MKNSKLDILLFLTSLVTLSFFIFWCIEYDGLTTAQNLLWGVVGVFLYCYTTLVVHHEFIHTPFFKSKTLNRLTEYILSVTGGAPQIIFYYHHMNHHAHSNSLKDHSSTYHYGMNGQHEHWFSYSLLSLFRKSTSEAVKKVFRRGRAAVLFRESLVLAAFLVLMSFINVVWLFTCFAPVIVIGWFFNALANYFQHRHASDPNNRYADSVSYYGYLYNKLLCYEGYHQEHHLEPQTHWTKRRDVRKRYLHEMLNSNAAVSKYPPYLGFLE